MWPALAAQIRHDNDEFVLPQAVNMVHSAEVAVKNILHPAHNVIRILLTLFQSQI